MFRCGRERKQRRLVYEDTDKQTGMVFSFYGTPLTAVSLLRYLGRMLSSSNNDWPEVEWNLWRERGKWGRLAKILGREGADRKMARRFYVEFVQVVLLFESETWVLIP